MRKTKWKKEVIEWEAEQDLAKQEKHWTHWKKPVLWSTQKKLHVRDASTMRMVKLWCRTQGDMWHHELKKRL